MKTLYRRFLTAVLIMAIFKGQRLIAQSDSIIIKVHFLHGSKPKFKFRHEEDRWFGGILGGHAGIEYEPNKIINFQPKARFHLFAHPSLINSRFSVHDTLSFYEILGGGYSSVKKTAVTLRISAQQKARLDSVVLAYSIRSPYDYAFFGMRCGAAAYDLLAQAGVVKHYSFSKTWSKLFYPRKTRRRLEKLARSNGYTVQKVPGSEKRIWEKD
jgi:hypothetical protein